MKQEPATKDPTVRNVFLLALCQALGMSCGALIISVTALVGSALAETKALATLPLALQMASVMATTVPASLLMGRIGRRAGFSLGAVFGMVGGGLSAWAIFAGSFALFCLASLLVGSFIACVHYYRFAAADTASEDFKSRAISLVLTGGLVAAFLGPELAKWSRDLLPGALYAGAYLCVAALAALSLVVLQLIEIPRPQPEERGRSGRPLWQIAGQPTFLVAALCGMVAYGSMNLVMTVTPLAVVAASHTFSTAALVIQLHIIGMYAPSFFTGHLIHRFGVLPILGMGAILMLCTVVVSLSGAGVTQFWIALVLLGLGWNFLFVGGSALLTETYRPEERAKAQGLNEFLIFGTVTVTALSSGALFHIFGWSAVNLGIVAPLLVVLAALLWLARRRALAPLGMSVLDRPR
jgi:MFS family permease